MKYNDKAYRHAIRAFSGPDPQPIDSEEETYQAADALEIMSLMTTIESRMQVYDH
ncbi:hypothetical protein BGZ49_009609, partial [Haplosporangium sp. Z 27]